MTSASNPPTVPVVGARIDAVADRIATGWGHHTHTRLTAVIAQLYTDLAVLSPHWSPRQRAEWITDAADATTTTELTTLLDDYLDHAADHPPVTDYGSTLHTDDRHDAVTAMLAALTIDHLTGWITSGLADFHGRAYLSKGKLNDG